MPAAPRVRPGGPRLGCLTYNLLKDYDLDTIIGLLEGAGYESVGLRTGHKHGVEPLVKFCGARQGEAALRRQPDQAGRFGNHCHFHSPDPAERKKQVEIGRQFIDLAKDTERRRHPRVP